MLYHRSFAIATLIVALALLCSVGYSDEHCNRSSHVDSGIGVHSGAYGHAEVVSLGWWDGYAGTTQVGSVTNNLHDEDITYAIVFSFRVVEIDDEGNWVRTLYEPPLEIVFDTLAPQATAESPYTNAYHYDEDWVRGRTLRAEAQTEVSAGLIGGDDHDFWTATACVDMVF